MAVVIVLAACVFVIVTSKEWQKVKPLLSFKRLRRPTGTTLGKPADIEASFNRALDEIHNAACHGPQRK